MAVIVLGEHNGRSGPSRGTECRTDAPIVGVDHVKSPCPKKPPDTSPKLRISYRHGMWALRVTEDLRQVLRSRVEAVDRYQAIRERSFSAIHGDRRHFDIMATRRKRQGQVADVSLLSADDRRIELRHHQDAHGQPKLIGPNPERQCAAESGYDKDGANPCAGGPAATSGLV